MKSNCQNSDLMLRSTVEEMLKVQEIQFQLQLKQQYEYFEQILLQLNKENRESPTFCIQDQKQANSSKGFQHSFYNLSNMPKDFGNTQNNIQLTESSENDHNFKESIKKQLHAMQNSVNSSISTKGPYEIFPVSNSETKICMKSLDNRTANDLSFNQTSDSMYQEAKKLVQSTLERKIDPKKNPGLIQQHQSKCKKAKTSRKSRQQLHMNK